MLLFMAHMLGSIVEFDSADAVGAHLIVLYLAFAVGRHCEMLS